MRYRGVQLPEGLAERVRHLITEHKELGYASVKEFVQDSVRRRVEQTEKLMEYEMHDIGEAAKNFGHQSLQQRDKASQAASNSTDVPNNDRQASSLSPTEHCEM